jgi:hypothetical protein
MHITPLIKLGGIAKYFVKENTKVLDKIVILQMSYY